ncbi:MAG TPA: radical SAM family heme chaperone HemW [Spongiibacteraceae bacterium]|nr:radical SAM family heme chaperone HemW [Spongiibacteraceae bacterium]
MTAQSLPPLSLYIHIPWCVRKCPYCDFNSHAQSNEKNSALPERDYLHALIADLELDAAAIQGRELHSIFFGGGTPSLFSPAIIDKILQAANARITFSPAIEITLEANPGTVEQQRFRDFRSAGINRLSLGIQSLNPEHLKVLGRIHDREQAIGAIEAARRAGFANINLDLMHGLPNQSVENAAADLNQALALEPEHLSWYQLTIEPNTEFYKRPPQLPEDDTLAAIQEHGFELLAAAGFEHYETSAFSQAGRAAKHNRNYWQFGDYIGIGAGAHGKLTHRDGRIVRTHKTRLPKDYLASGGHCERGTEAIAAHALPFEFMMNALRLNDGVPRTLFTEHTNLPWSTVANKVDGLIRRGLLRDSDDVIAPTPLGQRFLNDVLAEFLD